MVNFKEFFMRYLLGFWLFVFACCANAAELKIGDKAVFNVPVAKSVEELKRGLMFVRSLPEDGGMLFDFTPYQDRELSMWMKNTYIPLDMLFIGCNLTVVYVYKNAKPMSLDYIKCPVKFCYVLEVAGGTAEKKNILIGDKAAYTDTK